jgi:ABC-type polysaccharide/polyol phosphate transport system ATPase subunit
MSSVIEIEGLWKKFNYYSKKHSTLKETIIRRGRGIYSEFWALRDLSLSIDKGECWGIMGLNGAGKTTLFKLIARILRPTRGKIRTEGRICPILDLGLGFHADFTGVENIFTYGAIMGLHRSEVEERLASIIAFSGIEDFVNEPLRAYSTGMIARLGFSVAVHIDPDILLLDEVLMVGDGRFQKKCLSKLKEIKQKGTTIMMISHSPDHLRELCPQSLLIHEHALCCSGPTDGVIERYTRLLEQEPLHDEALNDGMMRGGDESGHAQ